MATSRQRRHRLPLNGIRAMASLRRQFPARRQEGLARRECYRNILVPIESAQRPRKRVQMSSAAQPGGPPLIRFVNVVKRFGGVTALRGVSLDVRAGEIRALLGENGAGKSTLIKTLGGIVEPTEGSIEYRGERYRHLGRQVRPSRRRTSRRVPPGLESEP